MSVDLIKNRDNLLAAWKDVLNGNSQTNWALFGYEGQTNVLKLIETGDGGLIELSDDLNSGKIMYAFASVEDPKTSLRKYILINWQGEGVPALRKGTCANHIRDVQKLFTGAHLTINARTEDEVDNDLIVRKIEAVGSAYSFKEPRTTHENAQSGPIGTNYSRVNPSKEISSQDRDNFWKKEEEEERHRVEEERERRDKEVLKQEQERRAREEKEHQERERRIAAEESEIKVPISNGKSYIQQPISPVKAISPTSPQRSVTAAEEMRQQRNQEAKELIGGRVGTAKAIWTQNSAAGQMSTVNKAAPVKPVRNSIAQRINSLNSNQQDGTQETEHKATIETVSIVKTNEVVVTPSSPKADTQLHTSVSDDSINPNNNHSVSDTSNLSPQKGDYAEEDDGDQFSTIKRSPYSKSSSSQVSTPVEAQPTATLGQDPVAAPKNGHVNNGKAAANQNTTETSSNDDSIYENLMNEHGLKARALYDYQADDETEISFDPGNIITHIDQIDEGWWQGLGPDGTYGLFPANYVELIH